MRLGGSDGGPAADPIIETILPKRAAGNERQRKATRTTCSNENNGQRQTRSPSLTGDMPRSCRYIGGMPDDAAVSGGHRPDILLIYQGAGGASSLRRVFRARSIDAPGTLTAFGGNGVVIVVVAPDARGAVDEVATSAAVGWACGRFAPRLGAGLIVPRFAAAAADAAGPALALAVERDDGPPWFLDNLFEHGLPEIVVRSPVRSRSAAPIGIATDVDERGLVRVGPSGWTDRGSVEITGAAGFLQAAGLFFGPEALFMLVDCAAVGSAGAVQDRDLADTVRDLVQAVLKHARERGLRRKLSDRLEVLRAALRLTQNQYGQLQRTARAAVAHRGFGAVQGILVAAETRFRPRTVTERAETVGRLERELAVLPDVVTGDNTAGDRPAGIRE